MKKIHNQKGFSHIETLLLTVILVIITGVGWYVWHSVSQANKNLNSAANTNNAAITKKKTTQTSTATPPAKASPITTHTIPAAIVSATPNYQTTTPTVTNNYITINEWNVRFKHSGTITIMYAHDANDKSAHAAFFTSSQLAAKNNACKAEVYPAGYIIRFKSDEHVVDAKGNDSAKVPKDYIAANASDQYKQIGDYYYFYRGPVAKCSQLKELQDLQNQTADAVKAFLLSLEAVPAQ
jgi:type II secretory pathway pseudopilin PulG